MEEIADRKSLHVFRDGRSFQLFSFFNMKLSGKWGKKAVLSKREPAREPILYFVILVVFRPASS